MHDCPSHGIVHVREFSFNTSEEKSKSKNEKVLRIVEAKSKDQTGLITFTLFGDLNDKVKEDKGYSMTYLRVGKYNNVRYLKTIENATFTPNDDSNVVVAENDKNIDATIAVRICAFNMKMLMYKINAKIVVEKSFRTKTV